MAECVLPTLDVVIINISIRAGIDPRNIDVSDLAGIPVSGLVLSGLYNGSDAIDALRRVYFFDPVETDGVIKFVLRGGASLATITEDDLVDDPEESKRGQALEFPRKVHVDYQNATIGYAPAKATAARSSADVRVVGELSLEVPVVLNTDEAAQVADKTQKVAWSEAQGEQTFTLGNNWLKLVPSDVVTLDLRNTKKRLRIERLETDSGVIRVTAKVDRQSAYSSAVTGPILREPTRPPEAYPGPATLAVMDIPALVDLNDSLGIYIAVSGESTAFAGAQVQISTDGGASFTAFADIRRQCRIGTLLNNVTAASEHVTDTTNTLEVDFGTLSPALPSFTDAQFLSERGSIAILRGDGSAEIMQYRDAVEGMGSISSSSDGNGVWTLSPLLRGRLNTGATAHTAGARVVYLEDAVFAPIGSASLGQDLTFRAVSFGETPEGSSEDQTITYEGRSQIEFPVLNLELDEDSLGNITATWVRRDRLGTDLAPITSANWQGYRVTFAGDTTYTVDTMATTATYDASGLGTSAVTVSVAQLNRITGAGPSVSEVI